MCPDCEVYGLNNMDLQGLTAHITDATHRELILVMLNPSSGSGMCCSYYACLLDMSETVCG